MSSNSSTTDVPLTSSVERLRHELDRWLNRAWTQGEKALDAFGLREAEKSWIPSIDLVESDEQVRVTIDLPGVDAKAVELTLTGNMLTVKGSSPELTASEHEVIHAQERQTGPFQRSIPLPVSVNPDEVHATFEDGMLHIVLCKSEKAKPRHIPVTTPEKATATE